MPPKTPHQITGGVNRKEWEALEIIWKENAPLVNKLISQFLGQTPFNQDLAMDVFEVLMTTEDHLTSQDDIKRFLNTTTINICQGHRKKMATRENHEGRLIHHIRSMENDDIEIAEATAYNQMLIRQKIARIPGKAGKVCHMHWIQKISREEIALTNENVGKNRRKSFVNRHDIAENDEERPRSQSCVPVYYFHFNLFI